MCSGVAAAATPSEGGVLSAEAAGYRLSGGVMLHLGGGGGGIVPSSEGGIQPSNGNMLLSEGGILHY